MTAFMPSWWFSRGWRLWFTSLMNTSKMVIIINRMKMWFMVISIWWVPTRWWSRGRENRRHGERGLRSNGLKEDLLLWKTKRKDRATQPLDHGRLRWAICISGGPGNGRCYYIRGNQTTKADNTLMQCNAYKWQCNRCWRSDFQGDLKLDDCLGDEPPVWGTWRRIWPRLGFP